MRYCAELPTDRLPVSIEIRNTIYIRLYQAIQDLPWKRVSPVTDTPVRVLGTLLVFCYFRELYSSAEIALCAQTDQDLQYICTGTAPDPHELRSFRRANRPSIEHGLATLLRIHPQGNSQPFSGNPLHEAKRRVDLAVRSDCFELDI